MINVVGSADFGFFGLFPGVFVRLVARFVIVPFASALVALVWVGWGSLPKKEKLFSPLISLITIVAIPLTTRLFDAFVRWLLLDSCRPHALTDRMNR